MRGAGCAGIFTGHAALELYCEVFDGEDSLDRYWSTTASTLNLRHLTFYVTVKSVA